MTDIEEIRRGVSELTVLSFRKVDDVKRLANHFRNVIHDPKTQENKIILRYLKNLDDTHRKIYLTSREGVEVEYIFTTEKKSSLQRQRFNSLPVSEVPELLKAELSVENARPVHICADCNIEIEVNDEEPLMESLQRHFNLEVHQPKLKRESIDVAEPVILPNMSRRLSALECGETPTHNIESLMKLVKPTERLDKMFSGKLEASLVRLLPDNSEASIDAAVKFYQGVYDKLCQEINMTDFSGQTSSVAPIIMSIKDNVNQNFASDANKSFENDDTEVPEKTFKNLTKKYRYYGPIENLIVKLLDNHKLLTLVDDRTGKLAFFCMACEYYTLRFRYDSVLNHIFSDTHIHNLTCILQGDKHIPFCVQEPTVENMKEINRKFLNEHSVHQDRNGFYCGLCKTSIDSNEVVLHILDENHLGRLSDKIYRRKINSEAGQDEWGPKSLDWAKFLASVGKPLHNRDHVVIENFIKPSGKVSNYCSCCEMVLKGPRQVLFNHIRQKKHLRNAAPHKLAMLYKNHCRPAEYYASFGNFFVCTICPVYVALPSFSAIVEHFDSSMHIETISKLIRSALYPEEDLKLLEANEIHNNKCAICDQSFPDTSDAVKHILSDINHQTAIAENRAKSNKGDIISVYMNGNYILHTEGTQFVCTVCGSNSNSIRSLLNHLVYAEHFKQKLNSENVFRFYLELKHNINMLSRNKYVYNVFGILKCGVCASDIDEGENAKRHVASPRHKENMGASYVSLETSAIE
ncbi:unnamed protein product [Pieris macdunnoughi]|uniref:C2H2-type domain-containing protein n=1 Tax=Pieris macdunnoughi TaxID=345717 RepID=A0A821VXW7_9NEOP|nr:unnamed protein product [Pieris macdunnoughi]